MPSSMEPASWIHAIDACQRAAAFSLSAILAQTRRRAWLRTSYESSAREAERSAPTAGLKTRSWLKRLGGCRPRYVKVTLVRR